MAQKLGAILLRGLETAPEFFVESLHDIQFHGVNTLLIPYRTILDPKKAYRYVPFTVRFPTGALAVIERQLAEFTRTHHLSLTRAHDETR